MKLSLCAGALAFSVVGFSTASQSQPAGQVVLPANTVIQVTTDHEITSKNMHEGDFEQLQAATDVAENGVVVIPRGAPIKATVTFRTGKGIMGKSAKFELTFNTVTVHGAEFALKGIRLL